MVVVFKCCYVWMSTVSGPSHPATFKNFYNQQQKRIREMCCLWLRGKFGHVGYNLSWSLFTGSVHLSGPVHSLLGLSIIIFVPLSKVWILHVLQFINFMFHFMVTRFNVVLFGYQRYRDPLTQPHFKTSLTNSKNECARYVASGVNFVKSVKIVCDHSLLGSSIIHFVPPLTVSQFCTLYSL